jgi:membrane protease YdiL (CAAX protease family)
MPYWVPFAGVVVLLTAALVALTRASSGLLDAEQGPALPPAALLLRVTSSQALFGLLLVAAVWVAGVPWHALGTAPSFGLAGVGAAVGVALAASNEAAMRLLDAAGLGYDENLRDTLMPESPHGWAVLLVVALPVVAGFEELLFRGILVGALATGFGVSPWLLAAASSVVFGAAHTAQGAVGVLATTLLGFALAAAYVVTGSLLVVFVAHYVVNAAEFALHAR